MPRVAIVIAALREEKTIADVVRGVIKAGHPNVIVVDDGSADRTSECALQTGATVLRHIINRGQGAALKTGIDYALDKGNDVIVTFDADGQHDPNDIDAMVAPVAAGRVDIALGSRFIEHGSNVPGTRRFALKGGALMLRMLHGVRLSDSHNGFRAMSAHAARRMELHADRMEHASEIIGEIGRRRLCYCEVPVTIRYTAHSIKNSKQGSMAAARIAWKTLLQWVMH